MSKKEKTIDLGSVRSGKYGNYISLDSSIKDMKITREYEVDGEKVTQVLSVSRNEKGYLNVVNIETPDSRAKFRTEKGWMTEQQAEKLLESASTKGIKSFLTVKVE